MGPQTFNSLGSESYPTTNRILKSLNAEHIGDSNISDNGTTVTILSNTIVNGTFSATGTTLVSGSSQVSFNGIIDKPTLVSGSSQISYTGLSNIPTGIVSGSSQITFGSISSIPSGLVSGSAQITLASTTGFGTYLNQAVLTTSTPTFSTVSATTFTGALSGNASTVSNGVYTNVSNTITGGRLIVGYSEASEPFVNGHFYNTNTTAGQQYGGVLLSGINQAHIRFQVGTNTWGASGAKQWQIRVGNGTGEDNLKIYSWTKGADTMTISSNGDTVVNGNLSATNLSGTNTGDETLARINALAITTVGTITSGTWNGAAIGNSYLANSSFNIGTTSISLGRASASQTLTGVSIDGNASTASSVNFANIAAGTRTNYTIDFKPPSTNNYAGFAFSKSTSADAAQDAGYLLIRGGTDNDIYTAEGITLVADAGWLTLAQRTTASRGIRLMTGSATSSTRIQILTDGTIKLSALTSNGFVKTSGSDGTLSIDTTTYFSTSSQVTLSSTTGFGTYLNQAVLTTSSPTFVSVTGTITSSGSGDSNAPFRFSADYSGWMNIVAGSPGSNNGWGLFWAGNSGAQYGTNGTGGPGNIWTNSDNPNEYAFVGNGSTNMSIHGNTGNVWIAGDVTLKKNLTFGSQGSKITFGDSTSGSPSMIGEGLVDTFGTDSDFLTIYARSSLRIFTTATNERARFDTNGMNINGTILPGANNSYNLGSATYGWANVYTNDLHLSNMNKPEGNDIDGTNGNWTIQEGAEQLYIINNNNGKKFKIDLTEII